MSPAEPVPAVREVEHRFRVHGLYRIPDLTAADLVPAVEDRGAEKLWPKVSHRKWRRWLAR